MADRAGDPVVNAAKPAATLLVAAAAALAACSFDYTAAGTGAEQLAEQVPETVLTGATHTVVRDGRVVAQIHAVLIENYPRSGRAVLEGVRYSEFDRAGNVVAAGSAERAVYLTASEDAELAGTIELRSETQEAVLRAEALRWDSERRRLSSGPQQMVEVARDDGSQVRGAGFQAELRTKTIRFAAPVTGTLVVETAEHD